MFKGRIYERRCDLSPNGELLIYFAAKHKPNLPSWTAISRPPYFTALALWPKGDCWNGGGWFVDDKRIRLNHAQPEAKLHPDFRPGPVKVVGYAEARGEDDTVWHTVLARDGWKRSAEGEPVARSRARGWELNPLAQWRKRDPKDKRLTLEMSIAGLGGEGHPWYQTNYGVLAGADIALDLGVADWADWDQRGNLLYAKDGCLFRRSFRQSSSTAAKEITDLNGLKFKEVPPTFKAQHW